MMRTILASQYGAPADLRVTEAPEPVPAAGMLLIDVRAASLNAMDWHEVRGDPLLVRLGSGLFRRADPRTGTDAAGVVVATGAGVDVPIGARVVGPALGAFAERALIRAARAVVLPDAVTFTEAATLPVAGCTALQALRDWGGLRPGGRVLVHGAGGGVGHLAVQLARVLGAARVDAVTGAVDAVRALGADDVVDHERFDARARVGAYDVVLDTVGTRSMTVMRALLAPGGRLANVGSVRMGRVLGPVRALVGSRLHSRADRRIVGGIARLDRDDLAIVVDAVADGRVRPLVSETVSLEDVAGALARLEAGEVRGKIVVAF